MEGELNEGSVPLYYREVHQAVSSRTDERVSIDVFQRLLSRTDLSVTVQNKITEHVDNGDGFLSKVSLYKALALIALAQQGKQPSPKLLENCIQEFPKPQLGDPKELQALRIQPAQDNPLLMSLSLANLLGKDTIKMELIPEKKGLFLKHVEYQVTSERFKISVYRRYSDFDVFHELLLQRYAYRMVPALPPKRMLKGVLNSTSEREFIEGRRRGLGRFLNLVARHPFFSEDELVKIFLTFNGSDVQTKLRDAFKKMGDEFMTYTYATQAKEYLPPDIQALFTTCRELIRNIHNSFQKLRDRAERMAERSKENSTDLLMFGKELSTLGCDPSPLPTLDSSKSMWADLRLSLRGLSSEFSVLSDKAAQQGRREEDDVVEKLNFFLDLLQSYRDLCERHEKGVLHEHQKVLQKYSVMKRQMMSAAVQPKEQVSVEQLESRIIQMLLSPHCDSFMKFAAQAGSHFEWFMKNPTVLVKAFSGDVFKFVREQQENAIQTMELRNYFSLFCVHQESQLIFAYLPITSHILGAFVNSQVQSHREMGQVWNNLHSKLSGLFAACNGCQSPPLTPK